LSRDNERVVIAFSARVAGMLLLLWGGMVARASQADLSFDQIPVSASIYLLLASGLRLGVIPLHLPFSKEISIRRGLGTMVRLVPAAASLVLLARTAPAGVPAELSPYLLALSGLAALYAGFSWIVARDELDGRPFWLLGMASLSLAAAVRGQPMASQAWGVAALLPGGLLFLSSTRHRYLLPLPLLEFVAMTMLPFTPAWEGGRLYLPPFSPFLVAFLVAQVFLIAGYLQHALREERPLERVERWVWLIYPLGLAFLPLSHYFIGLRGWQVAVSQNPEQFSFSRLLPGLLLLGLFALGMFWSQQGPRLSRNLTSSLTFIFSFQWLYRILWDAYRITGRLVSFLSAVFEGDGGILWALLLLTLFMSFLFQGRPGG
jgi:hypothetical protein